MADTQNNGTALITGASTGIGAVYADRLARRGYNLVIVARSQDRLNSLAKKLTTATGRSIEVVAADLTKPADVSKVENILHEDASKVARTHGRLGACPEEDPAAAPPRLDDAGRHRL